MKAYADPNKETARNAIWELLSSESGKGVMYLPASSRNDLDAALRSGFCPDEMVVCDKSAQVLSNFTRLLTPSERASIYRRSGLASDVSRALAKKGRRLGAVYLDFCGSLEGTGRGSVRDEVWRVANSGIIEGGKLAVVAFSGRERRLETKKVIETSGRHTLLSASLNRGLRAVNRTAVLIASGGYHNSVTSSAMLWAVFSIEGKAE